MSKRAEQKALEAYPISRLPFFPGSVASYDTNEEKRMIYEESYEQAEKDTIERACTWLSRHYDIDLSHFRKSMEEEQ